MKTLKKILNFFFNPNTGYYLNPVPYEYKGESCMGYVLCKGYVILGIPGYERIDIFPDREEAEEALAKINQG